MNGEKIGSKMYDFVRVDHDPGPKKSKNGTQNVFNLSKYRKNGKLEVIETKKPMLSTAFFVLMVKKTANAILCKS